MRQNSDQDLTAVVIGRTNWHHSRHPDASQYISDGSDACCAIVFGGILAFSSGVSAQLDELLMGRMGKMRFSGILPAKLYPRAQRLFGVTTIISKRGLYYDNVVSGLMWENFFMRSYKVQ